MLQGEGFEIAMKEYHPTYEKLIASVLSLTAEKDIERIRIEDVLAHASVSRGSLYHHFANFDDLIAASMARSFAQGVDQSIQFMHSALADCQTREAFRAGVKKSIAQTLGEESVAFRLDRARIIGLSAKYPSLRQHVAAEQERLSSALELLFRQSLQAGWVKADLDISSAVVFIQAYTFGKLIDDIADVKLDPERWSAFVMNVIGTVILSD